VQAPAFEERGNRAPRVPVAQRIDVTRARVQLPAQTQRWFGGFRSPCCTNTASRLSAS